jgi:hypothetical protein
MILISRWNNAPFPIQNLTSTLEDRTGNELVWDNLPAWEWDVSSAVYEAIKE